MLLYVDPGGGSYLVQMLIAAVLGIAFYFRSGWTYIKSLFRRKKDENK